MAATHGAPSGSAPALADTWNHGPPSASYGSTAGVVAVAAANFVAARRLAAALTGMSTVGLPAGMRHVYTSPVLRLSTMAATDSFVYRPVSPSRSSPRPSASLPSAATTLPKPSFRVSSVGKL